jgi:SAM-dependent methyltransferase
LQTKHQPLLENVEQYYSAKVEAHGATPIGVDWNSEESQRLRFAKLLQVCGDREPFSLLDYGCGYGALAGYLDERGISNEYIGFDISERMIGEARRLYGDAPGRTFHSKEADLPLVDYTVASGIFNVKLQASDDEWHAYAVDVVDRIAKLSRRGFAFNVLTLYSDPERRRPDLHYADPLYWFDHCKRTISSRVALLHDYPLYEFTILVTQ